ncbi:DUF397 domain-containing protein [Actinomadura viridis]|uniref:DUF397 domain-containing protein n=1 Tax=Actinomadura viridis TaxID=58110 RepID=UPI003676B4CC
MDTLKWRKSSRSNINGGECVELARLPKAIGIRDSKNPDSGHLALAPEAFGNLLHHIKRGRSHV